MAGFGSLGFPLKIAGNPGVFLAVSVGTQWETRGKNRRQGLGTKGFAQKKVLSLVLCVAMLLSVMVMGTGAVTLTDSEDISPQYREAAEVLTGMGIINGYEDDSFKPQQSIKRSEVATMIYRAATGDVTNSEVGMYVDYDKFIDVESDDWFAGYVNFCGNAELIKGYEDDSFGPERNVTGYEVLAMILRAVGYDQNNEFTGADWAIKVASTAQSLGILKNVQEATLGQAATRELVAELIFQAMNVKVVDYTPALGYKPLWYTLGEQEFKLKCKEGTADVWGRPSDTWTYNTGDKETVIEQAAAYTTNVRVDECDIAEALGLNKATAIESAYIDGETQSVTNAAVTTDRDGNIDPLDTTSVVGGQGRVTEVYDMGEAGLRLVEINTYLAEVTKVTPATTDKNGHTTDATVNLGVYETSNQQVAFNNVKATGFAKGDYVLVTITQDDNVVRSIEAATVTPAGAQTSWTLPNGTNPGTTTVGATTYKDADKFFLNRTKAATSGSWDTIVDKDGNLIGMVPSSVNYLIIEKIEWEHNTGVGAGVAMANLVLADGTKIADATIDSVNGYDLKAGDAANIGNGTVSDKYFNNGAYYNHIYSYTVNNDGEYVLTGYCRSVNGGTAVDAHNSAAVNFVTGQTSTIQNNTNTVVANDNTVFLVKNQTGDTYSYTAYQGVNNLPSMTVAKWGLCYLSDGTYATLVVINDYTLASNSFVAYVPAQDGYAVGYNPNVYAYTVYKAGSTEATTVYSDRANLFETDAFYILTVNASNVVSTSEQIMGAYAANYMGTEHTDAGTYTVDNNRALAGNLYWDRGFVGDYQGGSLANTGRDDSAYNDYRTNGTVFLEITRTAYPSTGENGVTAYQTTINTIDGSTISEDDRIIVAYTGAANSSVAADTTENATYVYVLKESSSGQLNPDNTGSIQYYVQFRTSTGVKMGDPQLVATQTNLEARTYPSVNWTFFTNAVAHPENAPGTFTVMNATPLDEYTCVQSYDVTVTAGNTTVVTFDAYLK